MAGTPALDSSLTCRLEFILPNQRQSKTHWRIKFGPGRSTYMTTTWTDNDSDQVVVHVDKATLSLSGEASLAGDYGVSIRKSGCRFCQCSFNPALCSSSIGSSFSAPGHRLRAFSRVSSKCGLIARQGISALPAQYAN